MAYRCKKQNKECDGCGNCNILHENFTYICPICGSELEVNETIYKNIDGEVIACDNCMGAKARVEIEDCIERTEI